MRILYTVSTYNPHTDGIQFVTSYLAEGLVKKGHSVDLIAYEYPDLTDKKEENINGVHVIRYPAKTVHMVHRGDADRYREYILENQSKYDVMVNVGSQTAFTDWLLPVMDQIHIPKVLHLHSVWDFDFHRTDFESPRMIASKLFGNIRWGEYFRHYRNAFRKYDAVLQLHEKDYGFIFFKKKMGINSLVLENAAEDAFFDIENTRKTKMILNVSNYCKRKNQLECVKVFEDSNLPDDWKLVLVGSRNNSYYRQLKEYCANELAPEKRDRVVLHVGIPRSKVLELVKSSSIYMMASSWEAFPISLLEAMAASVPYISSDVGIVKHLGGGLIAHTHAEFINHLQRLVNDEEFRIKLGEEGRQEACEKYKISKKVDQLEQILLSVIAGNDKSV